MKARPRAPTRKTKEAVDRRQSNKNVKVVSPRHCVAASVLATQLLFQLLCGAVIMTMSVAQLKQKKSNFLSPAPTPCS